MTELHDYVATGLYPKSIPFHVVLAGANVRPHTLAWKNGDGCLTDEEARKSDPPLPFVQGGGAANDAAEKVAFDNMSESNPFYEVNVDMYKLARMTGGIWGPLRVRPKSNECASQPTACDTSYGPSVTPKRLEYNCDGSPDDTSVIADYIDDIMGSNPFMIVPK